MPILPNWSIHRIIKMAGLARHLVAKDGSRNGDLMVRHARVDRISMLIKVQDDDLLYGRNPLQELKEVVTDWGPYENEVVNPGASKGILCSNLSRKQRPVGIANEIELFLRARICSQQQRELRVILPGKTHPDKSIKEGTP